MSQDTPKNRITFRTAVVDGNLTISRGEETLILPVANLFEGDSELQSHFAAIGLVAHLRKVTGELPSEERMAAMELEYDRIEELGLGALATKQTRTRGPRKAEKIAALAILEGATTDAIEAALAKMSKEAQEEVLNAERVIEQLGRMKRSDEALDLAA